MIYLTVVLLKFLILFILVIKHTTLDIDIQLIVNETLTLSSFLFFINHLQLLKTSTYTTMQFCYTWLETEVVVDTNGRTNDPAFKRKTAPPPTRVHTQHQA